MDPRLREALDDCSVLFPPSSRWGPAGARDGALDPAGARDGTLCPAGRAARGPRGRAPPAAPAAPTAPTEHLLPGARGLAGVRLLAGEVRRTAPDRAPRRLRNRLRQRLRERSQTVRPAPAARQRRLPGGDDRIVHPRPLRLR